MHKIKLLCTHFFLQPFHQPEISTPKHSSFLPESIIISRRTHFSVLGILIPFHDPTTIPLHNCIKNKKIRIFRCGSCFHLELAGEDAQLAVLVEEVQTAGLESDLDGIADAGLAARIDAGDDVGVLAGDLEVQVGLRAHELGNFDLRLDEVAVGDGQEALFVVDVLRTDTHDDFLADVGLVNQLADLGIRNLDGVGAELGPNFVALLHELGVEEVHLRAADEGTDEQVGRIVVQVLRGVDLLDEAVLHDDDTGSHGHGLGLVMSNVDEGGLQALMQLGDLGTHLNAELGVQVGQRLVEQEDLRVTNDGAAQRNALTLTTGQSLRLAVEVLLDGQDLSSLADQLVDLVLRLLAQLQTERHVVINGHVRIQRVVLENHRDVAILRSNVVNQTVADVELALGDLFKASNHAQGGGLTAARRSDQNDELLVLDVQTEVGNGSNIARVDLVDVVKLQACHV